MWPQPIFAPAQVVNEKARRNSAGTQLVSLSVMTDRAVSGRQAEFRTGPGRINMATISRSLSMKLERLGWAASLQSHGNGQAAE
jgi:hypothetical protein